MILLLLSLAWGQPAPATEPPELPSPEEGRPALAFEWVGEHAVAQLDNGLRVVVRPDHRSPRFATSLLVGVGSSEDLPGRSGKAHIFEHLMFEGSENVPPGAFDELLAQAGAQNNAWTSSDWTVYQIQGPREALPLALFLEADRLGWLTSGLSDEAIDNQRGVVTNERLGDESSDDVYPLYVLRKLLYPEEHPYHHSILGTLDDIAAVEAEELRAHFHRWYQPANATLVVVGDVDVEAVMTEVQLWFDALPSRPAPERRPAVPQEIDGEEHWVFLESRGEPALYVVWPTVPRGHPDEPALDVLSQILSSGRGSRLDDALYYRWNRTTGVGAWTRNYRLSGEFVITLSRDAKRLQPALRVVDRELARIRDAGVSEQEVDRIVQQWRANTVRALEDLETMADTVTDCLVVFDTPDCVHADLARYRAVTPADVQRVAQTWLGPDRVLLSVVSPGRDERYALRDSIPIWPD